MTSLEYFFIFYAMGAGAFALSAYVNFKYIAETGGDVTVGDIVLASVFTFTPVVNAVGALFILVPVIISSVSPFIKGFLGKVVIKGKR